jgi:hypothetical protein
MRILLLTALLLTTCSSHAPETDQKKETPVSRQDQAFRVIVPKETWEPIFFKGINERAAIAKLPSLRVAALPKDDLETRIWIGFGLTALSGFVLKRSSGQWSATFVQGIHPRVAKKDYQIALQAPKSGWDGLWQSLTSKGLLTLPGAVPSGCDVGALDGMSYVVENNIDNSYRTYMYDNPQFSKCEEAKRIIEISDLFHDEFASQLPHP